MTVICEKYKSKTGRHAHMDTYRCGVVKNKLHIFGIPRHCFDIKLDEVGYFSIAKKYKKPYYETVEYKKNNYNIVKWLDENISGLALVLVTTDYVGDLDSNGNFILHFDRKEARIIFTAKLDAMAFKMTFV